MSDRTELYPPWKELYDFYKESPYGTFISFHDISVKIHDRVYGKIWGWTVARFKKEMLMVSNKALENVRNQGYRIVNPNEHPRLICRETDRAKRRIRHGCEIAVHVDYNMLSDTERLQMTDLTARMMTLNTVLLRGVKKIKGVTLHYDLPSVPRPQLEGKTQS